MALLEAKDPCFKQIGTVKLGDPCTSFGISHKYGIACLSIASQLKIIHTDELLKENKDDLHTTRIQCQTLVCNEEIVVVGYEDNVIIYAYPTLVQDYPKPIATFKIKSKVKRLLFNPIDHLMLSVLSDDGNVLLTKIRMSGTGFQNWMFNDQKVTCMCFSPKGKQLCVGHASGDFTQLKLDLTAAKKIKGPGGIPVSLLWVSTTQFIALMITNEKDNISVVQIDVHKAQPPTYIQFGDVFLSDVVDENSQSFFSMLNDTIVCCSSTSTEVIVLLKSESGWNVADDIEDRRRAALPLDNFAVGALFYFNHLSNVIFTDTEAYGSMPVYIIGSQESTFTAFSFVCKGGIGENVKYNENCIRLSWKGTGDATKAALPAASVSASEALMFKPPQPFTTMAGNQQPSTVSFSFPSFTATSSAKAVEPQNQPILRNLLSESSQPRNSTPAPGLLFSTETFPSFSSFLSGSASAQPSDISEGSLATKPPLSSFQPEPKSVGELTISKLPMKEELDGVRRIIADEGYSERVLKMFKEFEEKMQKHRKVCREFNTKFTEDESKLAEQIEKVVLSKVGELEDFVTKMKKVVKFQKAQVEGIEQETLSHCSQIKYIQSLDERNRDPKYLQLLKAKPLDPAVLKRFREVERKVTCLKSQIQECRRHFYFAKCPPLSQDAATKFIFETVENHGKVLKKLKDESDKLREQLNMEQSPAVDDLTSSFRKATLDDPRLTINSDVLDELRAFVTRRNIIRCRSCSYADFSYLNGTVTNRDGFSSEESEACIMPPIPSVAPLKCANIATQTEEVLVSELENMLINKTTKSTSKTTHQLEQPAAEKTPSVFSFSFPALTSTPVETKPEIIASSNTSSLFGASAVSPAEVAGAQPLPGAKEPPAPSEFGVPSHVSVASTTVPEKSIFGSPSPATTSTSIFAAPFASSAASVFSSPAATTAVVPSIFGSPVPVSKASSSTIFSSPIVPAPSVFGAPSHVAASRTVPEKSILGSPSPATTSTSILASSFASPTASVFASPAATTSVAPSIFESQLPVSATSSSTIFGSPIAPAPSVFGAPSHVAASRTVPEKSILGSPIPATTSTSIFASPFASPTTNVFASPAATTSVAPSIFESQLPVSATSSSTIFGSPVAPAVTTSSIFQSAATTTQVPGSVFGATVTTSAASMFQPAAANTTQAQGLFNSLSFTSPTASTAALPQSANTTSVFGQTPAFGSTGLFGSTSPSSASIFGGAGLTSTAFGQQSPGTQPSLSLFGAQQESKPSFGGDPVFGGSAFGSAFGSPGPASSTGSIFGGGISQQSTFGQLAAQQPSTVFGGGRAFGPGSSVTPSSSVFGSSLVSQPTSFGQFAQQPGSTGFGTPSSPDPPKPTSFGGNAFSSWR